MIRCYKVFKLRKDKELIFVFIILLGLYQYISFVSYYFYYSWILLPFFFQIFITLSLINTCVHLQNGVYCSILYLKSS